jgi:hypothetical protein
LIHVTAAPTSGHDALISTPTRPWSRAVLSAGRSSFFVDGHTTRVPPDHL